MNAYDVVILGGGPAGYNAAIRAGQLGLSVACIEGASTLGGTCLNVGCMPSKALLHASERYAEATGEAFHILGIEGTPTLNLSQMMAQKQASVTKLVQGVDYLFRKNKVTWIKGWGTLAGQGQVDVRDAQGILTSLKATHIVIATGSEPTPLPGVDLDGQRVVDSTGALSFDAVPEHLIVIGAGIIGLELGSVWRRLGSRVTVLEYLDHVCPGLDRETGQALQKALIQQGLAIRLNQQVTQAAVEGNTVTVQVSPRSGEAPTALTADRVLVAIGRRPVTRGLGLETVGLVVDARGRIPHTHHQTAVPGIWVIGDVTEGPMLAHKAEEEAIACIELIAGKAGHVDYEIIPSVIYTSPEVASVGQSEEQLQAQGRAYTVGKFPFLANSRARITHETGGFVKVLADAQTDRVLGVHMIGPQVSEMIGEYCVALAFHASAEDVARTSHPHPTRSEALRQAAMAVDGWAMQM